MLDKSNQNYRLYLAGLISESKYFDLCEGLGDEQGGMDDIKLKQATAKFKSFMSTFEDIGTMTPENARMLLDAFLSAFLDHVRTVNPAKMREILADAIEKHKESLNSQEEPSGLQGIDKEYMEPKAMESVLEHSDGNDMLKRNLMDICDHSKMILSMLHDEDEIEEWMRYKISVSNASMSDVAHAFKHRKREHGGCFAAESIESSQDDSDHDPALSSLDSNWQREKAMIRIARKYFSMMSKRIARGEYSHPDFPDEGAVPEFQTWHGEGNPEGLMSHLMDLSEKMPGDLSSSMIRDLRSV